MTKNPFNPSKYFSWFKIIFKPLTLLLFTIILQEGFTKQIGTLIQSDHPLRNISIFFAIWVLSITGVLLASFTQITFIRLFWGVFFSVSVLAYLVFVQIMEYYPTLGDAKILWVETGQANSAFITYWSEILIPFFLTLFFFVAFIIPSKPIALFKKPWIILAVAMTPILPWIILSDMLATKGGGAAVGIPAGIYGASSYITSILYETHSKPNFIHNPVSYQVPETKMIKNIILVVDESVSGDFVSINQNQSITPVLVKNNNIVVDFGQVTAGHNCSSFSNAILRWGINPRSLVSVEKLSTIWQYAKKAGFVTTYIDSQKQPGTYENFMSLGELQAIDNLIQFKSPQIERDMDYISNDFKAAKKAIELTKTSDFNFIYINKLGAHVPYEGKYPESLAKYKPHMALYEPINNVERSRLINSYKNVISWNLGKFFEQLLSPELLQNTVVIYTSDHGQNLLEEGKATHCNKRTSVPYQGIVPLLVMTRDKILYDTFLKASLSNKNKASHFNIFPTVLTLMGYPLEKVEKDYTQTLFSPIQRIGKISRGNLLTPDIHTRTFNWLEIPPNVKSRLLNNDN